MKRTAVLISALALTGVGFLGSTGTASADTCPSGAVCAYLNENWSGKAYPVYQDNDDLTMYSGWRWAESIYNNGKSCNVHIYSEKNHGGARYPLNRGTGWKSIKGSAVYHHAFSNKWYGCK
ncbi:peptidase inhibitor family I36 protein [Streptomyces sp. NPDC007991]|uniref:peptidase inhibitor family I36 protein n=1 Tax=Streptomyces sp. NPDC007991 TaxID=3364803 RepID=UPI0036E17C34